MVNSLPGRDSEAHWWEEQELQLVVQVEGLALLLGEQQVQEWGVVRQLALGPSELEYPKRPILKI